MLPGTCCAANPIYPSDMTCTGCIHMHNACYICDRCAAMNPEAREHFRACMLTCSLSPSLSHACIHTYILTNAFMLRYSHTRRHTQTHAHPALLRWYSQTYVALLRAYILKRSSSYILIYEPASKLTPGYMLTCLLTHACLHAYLHTCIFT